MSASINKAILMGRLGKDPELLFTRSGSAVCNFSIATDSMWKDVEGQKQKRTEWHRIAVWGPQAELCAKYLAKGREVFVEGEIRTRSYDDKDGVKRYATEIHAREVKFLGGGKREDGGHDAPGDGSDDSEIPF